MTETFVEEILAFREAVFGLCLGFSKNPSDAEDLTHDVFLKAFEKAETLRDRGRMKVWLFRIARNTCLNELRNRRLRRLFLLSRTEDGIERRTPERLADRKETFGRMKTAVRSLPKKQRDVFLLRAYGELSYEDIAATLGLKIGTVMSRLSRARAAVLEAMEDSDA